MPDVRDRRPAPPAVLRASVAVPGPRRAVITGLTMLLIVDVRGVAFYFAWALIVLALATEALATFVYWRRSRANRSA